MRTFPTQGWTREAPCRSLSTGQFEVQGGETIQCGCWSTCLRRFGWCFITLLVFAAYAAWGVAAVTTMFVFVAFCIVFTVITGCDFGQTETEAFFEIISKRLNYADIGQVIYHKYCDKTKYTVRDNFIYALIGAGLLFVGQVNFFGIQVDNHRVARSERKKASQRLAVDQQRRASQAGLVEGLVGRDNPGADQGGL
eukprot:FR743041.1.p1 GENE.FR743041.1~~FR743041.1.p1  ORF type:complete len:196 (+),score=19.86 FR743041.1:95-682(+)